MTNYVFTPGKSYPGGLQSCPVLWGDKLVSGLRAAASRSVTSGVTDNIRFQAEMGIELTVQQQVLPLRNWAVWANVWG